jgi:hypothetical protein
LYTDASINGCCAILAQQRVHPDGRIEHEIIGLASHKFSPAARKWDTIKQEMYGGYYGFHHFQYHLRGKKFTFVTDHHNLLEMERSEVPQIVRWRIYMQSFDHDKQFVKGKDNPTDFGSRPELYLKNYEIPQLPPLVPIVAIEQLIRAHHISYGSITLQDQHTLSLYNMTSTELIDSANIMTIAKLAPSEVFSELNAVVQSSTLTPEEILKLVHGGRFGLHRGARLTYARLNANFPGHQIPYTFVADYVSECGICQKYRLGMTDTILPIIRHLKPPHERSCYYCDILTVTPADKHGNDSITVIKNGFTSFTMGYASAGRAAATIAKHLTKHIFTFGKVDEIRTDPGSEFTAEIQKQLLLYMGVMHSMSIVDSPKSNGTEPTNKTTLTLLRCLVEDERVRNNWSDDSVLPLIFFEINSQRHSETGVSPLVATFGSDALPYHEFKMNDFRNSLDPSKTVHNYVERLDQTLKTVRSIIHEHQQNIIAKRTSVNSSPDRHNRYVPGNFVLLKNTEINVPRESKLSPKFLGPYQVVDHTRNEVNCRNLVTGAIQPYNVEDLKLFSGTAETAVDMARRDTDQYVINTILAYKGDPVVRTTCSFEVLFEDGTLVWLPWTLDLSATTQFETYVHQVPQLYPLRFTQAVFLKMQSDINKVPIPRSFESKMVYVNLRYYNEEWYNNLKLPDHHHKNYVVVYYYGSLSKPRKSKDPLKTSSPGRTIAATCPIFGEHHNLNHYTVKTFGSIFEFDKDTMVLVNKAFILAHPDVLPAQGRESLLAACRA